MSSSETTTPYRVGQWLPSDRKILDKWLQNMMDRLEVEYKGKKDLLLRLHPIVPNEEEAMKDLESIEDVIEEAKELRLHAPVMELMELILTDPEVNMFFHQMFWQQYQNPNASEGVRVPCWQIALLLVNLIMDTAPKYNESGLVGFPINVIFNWPMATTAGYAAFLNDKINRIFKSILNYWGDFLKTEASAYVLTNDPRTGWFGEDAMSAMPNFVDEYICDPTLPFYGFKSWDDFFTRQFREGIRPVASPENDLVIANACESAPYLISRNVKKRDIFWIKARRYSMDFILNNNPMGKQFIGGTVYQAFLSALSYHRWHSPVSGTIVETELIDGSYYSQSHVFQDDPSAPNMSQAYLSQVAARGVIYIQADSPHIGLMAFVSIGMSEVSTNEITVKKGQRINKGDELGMFHFGGSTHLLIFRPGVKVKFDLRGQTPSLSSHNIKVREKIGVVIPNVEKEPL